MTEIRNKTGGRPAKSRIDKQNRVVSTKLTELQFYAIRKRAGNRAVCQRVRPAGGCFGRGNAPAEQAGCGHYPQAGRAKPTTSTSWRTGRMPEGSHWWRWNL